MVTNFVPKHQGMTKGLLRRVSTVAKLAVKPASPLQRGSKLAPQFSSLPTSPVTEKHLAYVSSGSDSSSKEEEQEGTISLSPNQTELTVVEENLQ